MGSKKNKIARQEKGDISASTDSVLLLSELKQMIDATRSAVAVTVNAGLTLLYWRIGQRVNKEILKEKRATYGDEIIATLSRQLIDEYGRGWSERNLAYMIRFNEAFPQVEILQTLCAKLSWSHFKNLELSHNPDFKLVEFDQFRNQAGLNHFVLSPKQWVEKTATIKKNLEAPSYVR